MTTFQKKKLCIFQTKCWGWFLGGICKYNVPNMNFFFRPKIQVFYFVEKIVKMLGYIFGVFVNTIYLTWNFLFLPKIQVFYFVEKIVKMLGIIFGVFVNTLYLMWNFLLLSAVDPHQLLSKKDWFWTRKLWS